ncbi:MAG: ammonia-forming cytochrome c nitrite reductase [Elusimicrobiota bacterium]
MRSITEFAKKNPWLGWLLAAAAMGLVFLIGLFAASIMERRTEALIAYAPATDISEWEPRSAVWGKHFPREYETYLKTRETSFRSKHNGSAMIDMLEVDPRLVVLWAGYGFSKDYNQGRGHHYAVTDIRNTLRTGAPTGPDDGPMPNTCWTCKSPDVPRVMGRIGPAAFYEDKWAARGHEIVNAIGCADCHDPKTMNLRISRPALAEAFERRGEDIKKADHQEMRALVCAQCHVEYYFKGKGNRLTLPWDDGTTVEAMEKYYDEREFKDWTHALSRAPMLKAQHPGWELFQAGIHAQRGLACADCHMPYKSAGGVKFSDHQIQSPLNNIATTCQVCHRESEDEFRKNVYERQDKNIATRDKAEDLIVKAHIEAKKAWDVGAGEAEMRPVLRLIRHAQWRWDYAAASHGASFHAPLEVSRILATSIDKAQEARLLLSRILARRGHPGPVPMPDISTKEKAQTFIGLDVAKLKKEKGRFLKTLVPEWDRKAREREQGWDKEALPR